MKNIPFEEKLIHEQFEKLLYYLYQKDTEYGLKTVNTSSSWRGP